MNEKRSAFIAKISIIFISVAIILHFVWWAGFFIYVPANFPIISFCVIALFAASIVSEVLSDIKVYKISIFKYLFFVSIVSALFLAWWGALFVPVPKYIPRNDTWKLLAKHSASSWGNPCRYYRFSIPIYNRNLIAPLKKSVDSIGGWHHYSQESSENIIERISEKLNKRWWSGFSEDELTEGVKADFRKQWQKEFRERLRFNIAPILGYRLVIDTEKSFVLLKWFRQESATHYQIYIRLINTGANKTTMEVWDYRTFDH